MKKMIASFTIGFTFFFLVGFSTKAQKVTDTTGLTNIFEKGERSLSGTTSMEQYGSKGLFHQAIHWIALFQM